MASRQPSARSSDATPAGRPRKHPLAALGQTLDGVFFVFAGLAALWLALLVFNDTLSFGWWGVLLLIVFWGLLAYLVLPRMHRILTSVYVPDYFIGRARTSDGLLGDPVNLALLGEEHELHAALEAAAWTRADEVTLRSSWGIIASTITRRSYEEAPVSPLFLFGRQQDFAYQQEVEGNPAQRHHVRFWKCPEGWLLPGGSRVDWLAAGTFDTAVGFSLFTLQVTHRIDADTDVERDHIVATVLEATPSASVSVLRDFSTGYHSRNGGGDSIRTDGDLPILHLPSAAAVQIEERPVPEPVGSDAPAWQQIGRRAPEKRPAFESLRRADPVEESVGEEVRRHGRPLSVTFGAAVVFFRAALAFVFFGVLGLAGPPGFEEILTDFDVARGDAAEASQPLWTLSLVVGVIVVAFTLLLGVLVLRGVNWARILLLLYATVSIVAQFAGWWAGDEEITFRSTLAFVALDILSLLALSGKPARQYSRRGARIPS